MSVPSPKFLRRKAEENGWVDGGCGHWSKEGVGYLFRANGFWTVQAWSSARGRGMRYMDEAMLLAEKWAEQDKRKQ